MRTSVVVVGESSDDMMTTMSIRSARLAGAAPRHSEPGGAVRRVIEDGLEYGHLVTPGTVVMPDFYRAMVNACDHVGTDYAYCGCAVLGDEPECVMLPTPGHLSPGQLLVRTWVLVELGPTSELRDLLGRVLTDYRGTEVPHVMVAEVGP